MKIQGKWSLIVVLNAIVGFIFGTDSNSTLFIFGILLGVLSWVVIYSGIDAYLQKNGFFKLSRNLMISACLRVPLQSILIIDIIAGNFAIRTSEFFGINAIGNDLISGYSTTMFMGFYLSIVCSIILLIVTLALFLWGKIKNNNTI